MGIEHLYITFSGSASQLRRTEPGEFLTFVVSAKQVCEGKFVSKKNIISSTKDLNMHIFYRIRIMMYSISYSALFTKHYLLWSNCISMEFTY